MRARSFFLVLTALPALLAAPASAAEATKKSAPARTLPIGVDARPHRPYRLNWTYPRFRTWQYAASVVTSGVNFYIEFAGPDYPDQRTRGPVPLDSSLRSWLRIESPRKAQRVALISDHIWYATQYFSFLDGIITPLLFDRGNFDVAWQLSMINWQGIGLSFFVTRLAHVTVGRARPSQYGCSEEPGAEFPCISAGPSFFSGHTSMSALGAGLTCAHHAALPLYGGGVPDAAVCALLVASTLTVGTMRIAADRHWASDVFVGLGVGGAIGLGLPYLLHYSADGPEPLGSAWLPRNVAVIPTFEEGRFGLAAIGSL